MSLTEKHIKENGIHRKTNILMLYLTYVIRNDSHLKSRQLSLNCI